jgi:hypothetical protein
VVEIIGWKALIEEHRHRYPVSNIQDDYKLLFQGMRGPGHFVVDEKSLREQLAVELADLEPDPAQSLLEPVRPDGRLCRIHLRAWLATGMSLDALVQECLRAAREPWDSREEFIETWQEYIRGKGEEAKRLTLRLEAKEYPPVHHSKGYVEKYRPAYRLVMK